MQQFQKFLWLSCTPWGAGLRPPSLHFLFLRNLKIRPRGLTNCLKKTGVPANTPCRIVGAVGDRTP